MIKNNENFNSNLPTGFDGKFDWDFLLPIFNGSKITPTDIDFMLERNDFFLVIETKSNLADIPMGQRILLRALHRRGGITIMNVFYKGNEKNPEDIEIVQILKPEKTEYESYSFPNGGGDKFIYEFVSQWWNYVNNNEYFL